MSEEEEVERAHLELTSLINECRNGNQGHDSARRIQDIITKYPQLCKAYLFPGESYYERPPLHDAVEKRAPLKIIKILAQAYPPAILPESSPWGAANRRVLSTAEDSKTFDCLLEILLSHLQTTIAGGWKDVRDFFKGHIRMEYGSRLHKILTRLSEEFPEFFQQSESSALNYAVSVEAYIAIVKQIIAASPDAVHRPDTVPPGRLLGTCFRTRPTIPLHHILTHQNVDMELLEILATPEAARIRDGEGNFPLDIYFQGVHSIGSRSPRLDVVQVLVGAYPESVHDKDKEGRTILRRLVQWFGDYGDSLPVIQFMAEMCVESIERDVDPSGDTLLLLACKKHLGRGQQINAVIRLLLQACPQALRLPNADGITPLHVLCSTCRVDDLPVIRLMVETDPKCLMDVDLHGCTPLHAGLAQPAYFLFDASIIQFLVDACPEALVLTAEVSASRPRTKWSNLIVEGDTPLHVACRQDKAEPEHLRILAEACPEVLVPGDGVDTPLHVLCGRVHSAAGIDWGIDWALLTRQFQALPLSEAAVQAKDTQGRTPLHLLCHREAPRNCLHALLKHSPAAAGCKDESGQTPLHVALSSLVNDMTPGHNYEETIQALLEACPAVSSVDDNGMTPLLLACEENVGLSIVYQLFSVDPISNLDVLFGPND